MWELLPDKRLQDEGRGALLELQLFVVQSLGVRPALGSALAQQHDAIIISQGQRTLGKETPRRNTMGLIHETFKTESHLIVKKT